MLMSFFHRHILPVLSYFVLVSVSPHAHAQTTLSHLYPADFQVMTPLEVLAVENGFVVTFAARHAFMDQG